MDPSMVSFCVEMGAGRIRISESEKPSHLGETRCKPTVGRPGGIHLFNMCCNALGDRLPTERADEANRRQVSSEF